MELSVGNKSVPDEPNERNELAELLAEEVRGLRVQLNDSTVKAERKRLGLMIDVRRWKMGLHNPKKYGKKPSAGALNKRDLLRIFEEGVKP
jgi:hypothetical protein